MEFFFLTYIRFYTVCINFFPLIFPVILWGNFRPPSRPMVWSTSQNVEVYTKKDNHEDLSMSLGASECAAAVGNYLNVLASEWQQDSLTPLPEYWMPVPVSFMPSNNITSPTFKAASLANSHVFCF